MAKTRGSRRAVVMLASALVMLAATTSAAGAARLQTDCEDRPLGIGCDRSSTTAPGEEPAGTTEPNGSDQPDTTYPKGDDPAETSLPSADGASAGVNEDDPDEDPAPVVDTSGSDDDGGTSPLMLGAVLLLGLGAGVAGGAALMASRQRSALAPAAAVAPVPPAGGATADDRRRLVQELIDVRDQVSSDALRSSIGSALAEVGVLELAVPAGTVFDPQVHKGVDRVATDDPGLDRTVAETERPGYVDRGETVRLPEVVVRRLDTPEAAR